MTTYIPSADVAKMLRTFLKSHLPQGFQFKVLTDRRTGNLHLSILRPMSQADRQQLALLVQSFAGSRLDLFSGFFNPADRYLPGLPDPFRFGNPQVFLACPTSPTAPGIPGAVWNEMANSRLLPWANPRP